MSIQCGSLIKGHLAGCPPWEWTWERMCVVGNKFYGKLQKKKLSKSFVCWEQADDRVKKIWQDGKADIS